MESSIDFQVFYSASEEIINTLRKWICWGHNSSELF